MSSETIAVGLLFVVLLPLALLKFWALYIWDPRRRADDDHDDR